MKTLRTLMSLSVLAVMFSCTKSNSASEGYLTFSVETDEVIEDVTKGNVSDLTALPSKNDFILDVKDASGSSFWSGKVSEWDPSTKVPFGEYTVNAVYGDLNEEGFDKPYFEGSKKFFIQGTERTAVSVNASLANTAIRISCTDNLKNYYSDYTFRLERGNSVIATFPKGETKAAFVDGYKVTVAGTLTTSGGVQKTFSKEYTNLNVATVYNVIFDIANVGGGSITISFNDKVETVQLDDVELND